jgi:ferric-dicitrate binding protein FerR (iron transport regulator)
MKTIQYFIILVATLSLLACGNNVKVNTSSKTQEVNLPDGSVAILNENSSIEYSKTFSERVISQTGEVFYQVEKGDNPFTVETAVGKVKALGTSFNVKENGEQMDVQVETGKVEMIIGKLSETIIKGQRAAFKGAGKAIEIGKANFDYKTWQKDFDRTLKKAEKEFKKGKKQIKKESKKISKEFKKEMKKLKKQMND